MYVVCILWDEDPLTFILSKEWIAEHQCLPGFLQQVRASMKSVLVLLGNCLQQGMIL